MAAHTSALSRRSHRYSAALTGRTPTARLVLLSILLPAVCVIALGTGALPISASEVLRIVLQWSGQLIGLEQTQSVNSTVVISIRLPRVLLAVLVGGAMSVAGAALQGLFRNPLAEPGLIGVSGGAALGAACAIVLQIELTWLIAPLGQSAVPVAAFLGGFLVTMLVYRLGTYAGQTNVTIMLLAGVAIQALTLSGIGFMQYLADDTELRDLTFWMLGSLGGASWRELAFIAPWILAALFAAPFLARALNALLLGEAEARHLGFNAQRMKLYVVVLASVTVGVAVSAAGIIQFVGLIVPHLVRLLTGPDHRYVLPGSMLLGATLVVVADALARTIVSPAELPIGILFAFLGAPFFVYLLYRSRHLGGI